MSENYRNQNPMVKKIYEVKLGVRNNSQITPEWAIETFRVFGKTPDGAWVRALIQATQSFPLEGWDYDHLNATVEELSHEQIGRDLEDHRNRIMEEGQKELEKVLDDLEKIGVFLRRPATE